ncbi:RHS repeat-associated core domain-containing protein [Desulforudis sp. 1031]|uniref:RHS repeat-associated core domain-containing protein n=2 Tax=Candidatus Desulforudis TaxID=471826 RepID=UPI003CE520DB
MTFGPLNGRMVSFTYDARNRLTAVGGTAYQYDAEGNRISVTDGVYNTRTDYVVNPHAALSQVLVKTDEQGHQTYYVYGLGLIGQEENGVYRTYHFNLRGSTVALTDNNGAVTDRFQYGPYGELVNHTGGTDIPFLYNGRDGVMTDANGLYYMRARYYDPEIRRFINKDVLVGRSG